MRKIFSATILLSMAFILLAGCGGKENPGQDEVRDTLGSQESNRVETMEEGEQLFANEHISLELKAPDQEYTEKVICADTCGGKLYLLAAYREDSAEKTSWNCFLNVFDGDTRKLEQSPFTMEIPGKEEYYIVNMEARNTNELSFRLRYTDEGGFHDFLVRTDMQGTVLAQEENFPDASEYPWNASWEENRMVFDNPESSSILCEWGGNEDGSRLYEFDQESGSRSLLGTLDGEYVMALCLGEENTIYYIANGNLVQWDVAANTRKELFRIYEIGVPTIVDYTGLLYNSSGETLICCLEGEKLGVFVLSKEEILSSEEIRLAYVMEEGPGYSVKLAQTFAYEHPQCPIRIEGISEDRDAYRDRIFMELAAGQGPELMWVSKEDMAVLEEKGVLMDISELIPEDIMEQLFPCVIQDGTVNGRMVGILPWFSLHTMVVADDIWPEASWTLSDMLEIIESREDWEVPLNSIIRLDAASIFRNMLISLRDTPFLDMEEGRAHFDSEEFKRLLEVCRRYGGKPMNSLEDIEYISWDEVDRIMGERKCVAQLWDNYDGLAGFSSLFAQYGEDVHIVGYPSYGSYMANYNGYLVVNAKAEHLEEIREFISLLLDYDNQFTVMGCSVRRDVTRDGVVQVPGTGIRLRTNAPSKETGLYRPIDLKPDGTSYLEEYMEFLENCIPMPADPSHISEIIYGELESYFSGDKELEDMVEILQNRVQLYLDEGGR